MSIRKLFAILLALSVLLAPGLTGAAMAAAPHHDMQMMEAGHCEAPPSQPGNHDKAAGKGCCIAMCMALAVTPTTPNELSRPRQEVAQFAPPKSYQGLPAEIATPPPRPA